MLAATTDDGPGQAHEHETAHAAGSDDEGRRAAVVADDAGIGGRIANYAFRGVG